MKRIKLTKEEQKIEDAIARGEYVPASKAEFKEIAQALARLRNPYARTLKKPLTIRQGHVDRRDDSR